MQPYWAIFGLDHHASPEELHKRYRQLVKQWHPDQFAADPKRRATAEAYLKLINEAYCSLRVAYGKHHQYRAPSCEQNARREPENPAANLRWLRSEWTLTYLPLVVLVLIIAQRAVAVMQSATYAVAALLAMAWTIMVWEVWRNKTLSAPRRIVWIALMMLFAGVAVPIYFARHVRARTRNAD